MIESHAALASHPKNRPQRGRPIGSGIDDRARLDAIRALMAQRPGMQPTTAIRALGHDNPSVIRRLRDKLRSCDPEATKQPHTPTATIAGTPLS